MEEKVIEKSVLGLMARDSWCEECRKADLGIINLEIQEENGKKFVVGNCKVCGSKCQSEILEVISNE